MKTTYAGRTIEVTSAMKFKVTGDGFGDNRLYVSLDDAKNDINKWDRDRALEKKAGIECNFPVVIMGYAKDAPSMYGNMCCVVSTAIRGMHTQTQLLLFKKPTEPCNSMVFPNVPWIRALLEERVMLNNRGVEIDKQLNAYMIQHKRGYGHIAPEYYPTMIEKLKADYEKKLAKANEVAPQ